MEIRGNPFFSDFASAKEIKRESALEHKVSSQYLPERACRLPSFISFRLPKKRKRNKQQSKCLRCREQIRLREKVEFKTLRWLFAAVALIVQTLKHWLC